MKSQLLPFIIAHSKNFVRLILYLIPTLLILVIRTNAQGIDKDLYFKLTEATNTDLAGKWGLILGEHVSPSAISKVNHTTDNVPGTWNGVKWQGESFSGKGIGTYFCWIILEPSVRNERLAIAVQDIGVSYRLFINNQILGGVGKPGETVEETEHVLASRFYSFQPISDTLLLTIHVSNFSHENGGLWSSPRIGTESNLRTEKDQFNTLDLMVLGTIFIIGFYHLYLYFRRKEEYQGLIFFLICLCLLAHSTTKGDITLVRIFPNISWVLLKKIEYSALVTVALLNTLFVRSLFPKMVNPLFTRVLFLITTVSMIITWVLPPSISHGLIYVFQVISIVTGIYLIYLLITAYRRNLNGSGLLLLGLGVTFIFVVNDILRANYVLSTPWMVHYGMFVYVSSLAMVLANRFTTALKQKETLTQKLESMNEELEDRVEDRTRLLSEQQSIVANQNQILKNKNQELNRLMAVVAHDLKSPFSQIYNYTELLQRELEGDAGEMNRMIRKIATDGNKIIDNLVNLKSYEDENFQVSVSTFDLKDFVGERVAVYSQQAEDKGIEIAVEATGKTFEVFSDKERLSRIFDNLLSNAVKYSAKEGKIIIGVHVLESKFSLTISDSGPGFTDEDQDVMYGKFQKLSARPTAGEESTGLGLSIVKILTSRLNGEIDLTTDPKKGSTFTITFPKEIS